MVIPAWRSIRTALWWLLATLFVLFALWVLVARQLMLSVDQYRQPLEQLFEDKARTPMEIGTLSGRMEGLNPRIVLQDVRLYAPEDATETLRLDQVDVTVDLLASLWHRELRVRYLRLQGLDVQMAVTEEGDITFAGIRAIGSTHEVPRTPLERVLDIAYRQRHIELADTALTLVTPNRPVLRFRELQGLWVKQGGRFRFAFQATERAERVRLEVRLHFHNRAYRWQDLSADGYAKAQVQRMEPWLLPPGLTQALPVRPTSFSARAESWLQLRPGARARANANVWLSDLALATDVQADWQLDELGFQLHAEATPDQLLLQFDNLQLSHHQHLYQLGHWQLDWQQNARWQLSGRQLRLQPLQQLIPLLPTAGTPAEDLARHLASAQVSGELVKLTLEGQGAAATRVAVRFRDLGIELPERQLGVDGLAGWLVLEDGQALAWLDSPSVLLTVGHLLDAPVAVGLQGPLGARWQGGEWHGMAQELVLENHDARAVTSLVVRGREGQVPELSLLGRVEEAAVARAGLYIPFGNMPESLAAWLREALQGGTVKRADFLHEGPVRIDPLRQQDRTFQMLFEVAEGRLHFHPGWPTVEGLSGQVVIDGREVRGRQLSGRFLGLNFNAAAVEIPLAVPGQPPTLTVQAAATSSLDVLTQLFEQAPLASTLPEALTAWQFAGGQLAGNLKLALPLITPNPRQPLPLQLTVGGDLRQGRASNRTQRLELTQLEARYRFDLQQGLTLENLQGQLLGYPFQGRAFTDQQRLQFHWRSEVSMPVLRNWLAADWLEDASGTLGYQARLSLPWRSTVNPQLVLTSDLHRVQLALPTPFFKPSSSRVPSELTLHFMPANTRYDLRYGNSLRLQALTNARGLERMGLRVGGGAAFLPEQRGVLVRGDLGTTQAESWVDYVAQRFGQPAGGEPTTAFLPWNLDLGVQRLNLWGAEIVGARLTGNVGVDATTLQLDSARLAGSLSIPRGYRPRGGQPMVAAIQHFHWHPYDSQAQNAEWRRVDPTTLPAIQVDLQRFYRQREDMGAWQFELMADERGVIIQNLQGRWRGLNIQGNGLWQQESVGGTRSYFSGQMSSDNVAAMLTAWGWPVLLDSPRAQATLTLNWPGAPYEFDLLALRGEGDIKVETGRFPKADNKTSALRLLGVFNLATVTRRLRLDFSDLYRKGLSFETFSGHLEFAGARLVMKDFLIDSPSAEFAFSGDANLQDRTLNHHLEVTLPLSSNLYVGCIAGPVACAGIFVVERLWGSSLEKMTSLHYRVTGSWDNPQVEDVTGSRK